MRDRTSTDFVSVLVSALALGFMFFSLWNFPPGVDRKVHSEIGRTLAAETLSLLEPGGKITVISRDIDAFPQPALGVLLKSFERELQRAGRSITSVETIQLDPLRPVEVPAGDFYELLRKAQPGSVIVSLLGPPVLTEEQRAKLGRPKGKVVALCTGNMAEVAYLPGLFKAGLLHAAIVNKRTAAPSEKNPLPRYFDQLYTVQKAESTGVYSAAFL